ncbi:phage regulatory CII family protein [Thalassospira sp.]|uniref:phage regulatory CII family protein n=1 Tax=Thalassospira sp. TaxID=1912094 RepID=UPI003AA8737C
MPGGIQKAADFFEKNYQAFYSRLARGRVVFSADEIRQLVAFTQRRELVDYLLADTGFLAVKKFNAPSNINQDGKNYATHDEIQHGAKSNVYIAAEILQEVDRALIDHKIDHQDKLRILEDVHKAEVALASLRDHLSKRTQP